MRQITVIRKADIEKAYIEQARVELDYQLLSLYEALQNGNKEEADKIKKRLHELHKELSHFNALP